ncbi:hypothetical protein NQ317_010128 [Molorchus minor]|uniref:Protein hunchback n=1 Tax=Molorchus minor TaxID=1323400 RepID=A0ABQ9JQ52_9CUCU|nr:hypothetical protein NQ317_010128 [Molorchus minor]
MSDIHIHIALQHRKMKEDKPVICRLCLNLIEDGSFDLLDEVKKQMLNTLLPNMNLACPTQPVICKHCTTVLHNSYHFKTEFLNYMKNVEPQIKDKKHQCIYCLTVTKQECTAAENILLKEMLTQCFPENDVIESTSICEKCVEPLHSQYIFVSKCLEVEEKITVYSSKTGSSGEVNLFDVVNDKYTLKESNNIRVDFVSLKTEPIDFPDPITIEEKDIKDVEEKTKIYKCELCDYKTHRKSDLTLRHMLRHKNPEELKMYRCTECSYQTKRRGDLTSHLVTHKDSVPVYKCATCHYKTIYKDRLAEHVVKHKLPREIQVQYL